MVGFVLVGFRLKGLLIFSNDYAVIMMEIRVMEDDGEMRCIIFFRYVIGERSV